ncbi:monocarboxylate transporter 12-like [Watersipora subatra]|uniref:monocarboxylate transporter 12-like n=1 Tax=Watersipora subatra TaxID=2589382 RepID=UPI00355BDEF0
MASTRCRANVTSIVGTSKQESSATSLYFSNACERMCPRPTLRQDKGFAWFILAMSFLSHALHLGFTYAVIGNLTVIHQSLFGIDLQLSSFIGSVHAGVLFLFAPVASVLVKKLRCRATEILGGLCLILGIGLSYFSSQPWHAFLLFGLLGGIGVSCVYVASSEVLALNFTKYKYLAFSIAVLGYYGGMVAFPIVSQKLFDLFGYNHAMAIMASFHVVHLLAGCVFYQPSGEGEKSERSSLSEAKSALHEETAKEKDRSPKNDKTEIPLFKVNTPEENLPQEVQLQSNFQDPQALPPVSPDSEKELMESGTTNLKDDFKILLASPKIWAMLFNGLLWNINVASFFILVTDFALQATGINKDEAAFGVTIVGITNIAGCLLVISVSALRFDRLMLHFTCTLVYGITTVVMAFSSNKAMFYAMVGLWGLAQGASIANLLGVLDNFCGVKQLALLFGLYLFAEGFGALGGPPLCGYVSDKVGIRYGLILAGCAGIAGSLCILPVIIKQLQGQLRNGSKRQYSITTSASDEKI